MAVTIRPLVTNCQGGILDEKCLCCKTSDRNKFLSPAEALPSKAAVMSSSVTLKALRSANFQGK
jgi:hypothetical protein